VNKAEVHSAEFETLRTFAEAHVVTIGVNRSAANTFLARQSFLHLILNWLGFLLFGISAYSFISVNWMLGVLCFFAGLLCAPFVQSLATRQVRLLLLDDEALFDQFYEAGSALIRLNTTGHSLGYPENWRTELMKFCKP
jgi:hypothetical protein